MINIIYLSNLQCLFILHIFFWYLKSCRQSLALGREVSHLALIGAPFWFGLSDEAIVLRWNWSQIWVVDTTTMWRGRTSRVVIRMASFNVTRISWKSLGAQEKVCFPNFYTLRPVKNRNRNLDNSQQVLVHQRLSCKWTQAVRLFPSNCFFAKEKIAKWRLAEAASREEDYWWKPGDWNSCSYLSQ